MENVFERSASLTQAEEAAARAYGKAILPGKNSAQGRLAHEVAGASLHMVGARCGQSTIPRIKPGSDFIKHGGAAQQKLRFHAGYMTPEQFQAATAQTLADNVVCQQGTGLVKLRQPTIHIDDPYLRGFEDRPSLKFLQHC
jgi:hypothetical protein